MGTKKRREKEWNGKKENKERKGKGLLLAVYSRDISRKEFATGERAVRGNCEKVSSWNRETFLDVFSILLHQKNDKLFANLGNHIASVRLASINISNQFLPNRLLCAV